MEGTIIIADDDKSIRTVLGQALTRAGCRVKLTGTISTLWKWIEDGDGDVLIVDVMMPDGDTLDILPVLKRKRSETPVIVMSAVNTVNTAVRAIDAGAFDYLSKPFELSQLVSTVNLALKSRNSKKAASINQNDRKDDKFEAGNSKIKIIGSSQVMQRLYKDVAKASSSNFNILINGLSGTGKSLLAGYIHEIGSNNDKSFYSLKLGSLNEFQQIQIINEAISVIKLGSDGIGTFFFDEVSSLTSSSQRQLLKLFELTDIFFVNDNNTKAKPSYISSTSVNLEEKMLLGNFRQDLYFRINGISLNLPKLSNRNTDIPELVNYFLGGVGNTRKSFSPEAIDLLQKQEWIGNVRELKNFVLRVATLCPNIEILPKNIEDYLELRPDLAFDDVSNDTGQGVQLSAAIEFHLKKYFENHGDNLPAPGLYDRLLRELEVPLIKTTLAATRGNQIRASRLLGLNRNTLRKKIHDLKIKIQKN